MPNKRLAQSDEMIAAQEKFLETVGFEKEVVQ
jgi:hypothetical protein